MNKYAKVKRPAIRVMRDGREVCDLTVVAGRQEYELRKRLMWDRQLGNCCLCNLPLQEEQAFFEHEAGRGFEGSHRDDRIEVDGKWINGVAHYSCNTKKGSVRGTYNERNFTDEFADEIMP